MVMTGKDRLFSPATSNRTPLFVLIVAGILAIPALLLLRQPEFLHYAPPCPFFTCTGLECPGCGTLRALHQAALGNFSAAFGLNPLAVLSTPFLLFSLIRYCRSAIQGNRHSPLFVPAGYIWIYLVVVVAFGVLRNLI